MDYLFVKCLKEHVNVNNMKAIQLTDEHRSKLLEMCEKLFPEYTHINMFVNGWEYSRDMDYIAFDNLTDYGEIHWFEFCMTQIAPRVCKSQGIIITFDGKYNPIDYLYSEFKKLKT